MQESLTKESIALLKKLITTPSFSKEEVHTASLLEEWYTNHNIPFHRKENNIWAFNAHFDASKPTILLNSHHDTVKPNKNYTRDPFEATLDDGKLYGLGSNDAGGCLVSLMATFAYFYKKKDLNYNLLLATTAEEEISGDNGVRSILSEKHFETIEFGIVGEPTLLDLAIAEKGLVVMDIKVIGTSGHAAHIYDNQAMMRATDVLQWFKNYEFPKVSKQLGKVKMTVTQVQAGSQHNVVPSEVNLVVDIRVNDKYTNKEIFETINTAIGSEYITVTPRSLRLNSSSIPEDHAIVQAGIALGKTVYGSPTISDQANFLNFPSLKVGPGDSKRSHSADEFIYLQEIEEGIKTYIALLDAIL